MMVEIADLRAERDHWKEVAGHAGELCVNLERVLADAQARVAELEGTMPDIMGMQDGSLVRDLRAENARLEAAFADAQARIVELERRHAATERDACIWARRAETAECDLAAARERVGELTNLLANMESYYKSLFTKSVGLEAENARLRCALGLVPDSDPLAPQVGVEREEVEGG